MTHLAEIPLWAAIPAAALLLLGAGLALIGSFGLFRLDSFYDRIHAPTLGTSWGTAGIVIASMIVFSVLGQRLVLHELLIALFVTVTTPVTLMMLGRAALYRDRAEGREPLPGLAETERQAAWEEARTATEEALEQVRAGVEAEAAAEFVADLPVAGDPAQAAPERAGVTARPDAEGKDQA